MKKIISLFICYIFLLEWVTVVQAEPENDYDIYGGWKSVQGKKTGFFHTEKISGKWWIVSPEGNAFFSKGVNSVHSSKKEKFSISDIEKVVSWLKDWGMNTAGCWSDPDLMQGKIVVALRPKTTVAGNKKFPDVFDPKWKIEVQKNALKQCALYRDNPWVLGYFTDNERPWKHEDEAGAFLKQFFELPSSSAGYQAALEASLSGEVAIEAFREKVAEIYFKTTAEAFRKADPNHMILGCRFAGRPPLGVVKKMKGYADIISLNNYMEKPPSELIQEMSNAADLPVMVTEFSFKGPAPGLDQSGSGPEKSSQAERSRGYENYIYNLLKLDCCVGYHWFKWSENWQGVLQADGQPFPELTQAFKKMNGKVESLR
jgi:hypothetical protein